ncbi:MAG: PH domain-containing protein [Kouleothrix sp.]|jgi:hypothetical protein|nr:PH domain-containing protein [Kouleothrix sp.]
MFCSQCGKQIAQENRFCNFCGAPQQAGVERPTFAPYTQPMNSPTTPADDGRERIIKEAGTHLMKAGPSAMMAQRKIIVTNRRVIYREGILGGRETSVPLNKITDVSLKFSAAGRLAGYGTIRVESAGSGLEIMAEDIADARGVRDAIMKLIR